MSSKDLSEPNYSPQTARVCEACEAAGVAYELRRTEDFYYERDLMYRAEYLGCSQGQLCKLLLLENTKHSEDLQHPAYRQYLAVLLQYTAPGLYTTALDKYVRKECSLSKRQCTYRSVKDGEEVSGFQRGGLSPFGLKEHQSTRFLVDTAIPEGPIWVGGGEVDVKLCVDRDTLVEKLGAAVMDVCSRDEKPGDVVAPVAVAVVVEEKGEAYRRGILERALEQKTTELHKSEYRIRHLIRQIDGNGITSPIEGKEAAKEPSAPSYSVSDLVVAVDEKMKELEKAQYRIIHLVRALENATQ